MSFKRLLLFISLAILLASCSGYQHALRSDDVNLKYRMAEEYYKKGDYQRAAPLYDALVSLFKGTAEGENVYYKYADCYYQLGEYMLSAYHFKYFAESFPLSPRAEEAYFMWAYSLYQESPIIDLDQSSTKKAVDAFQLFIDKFPNSTKVEKANKLIDELNAKLELKQLNNAMLYYQIEDYKSATWALKQYLIDYPNSVRREELEYYIVRSSFLLAKNSVEKKQEERFLNSLQYCTDFMEKYPKSKYAKDVKDLNTQANINIQKLKLKFHE